MNQSQAFELALKNFPKWMDVRKRSGNTGGRYLKSMTDEVEVIAEKIEEIRKTFFAKNYLGNQIETLDYVHHLHLGQMNGKSLTLIEPAYEITDDWRKFNESSEVALFESGTLFVRYDESRTTIKYKIGSAVYEAAPSVYHIWNTIDEFALYSGIERHELERNESLLARIFSVYKDIPNNSALGLKNAITNEVQNYTDISIHDIDIDFVNKENAHQLTSAGERVIEDITKTNKDLLRTKVWDKTKWVHDFKQLDYIPNEWDSALPVSVTGTGQLDDLKVSFLHELGNQATDIEIDLYKKSEVKIEQYIKNNQLDIDVPLVLTRYKDELTPITVDFKVTAEDAYELDDSLLIESAIKEYGEFEIPLGALAIDRADKEYTVEEQGKLTENEVYKIRLTPLSSYDRMHISTIRYKDNNKTVEYAKPKPGFVLQGNAIESTKSAYYGSRVEDFYSNQNIRNVSGAVALADTAHAGEIRIDVTNIENQYITYDYSAQAMDITLDNQFVSQKGFTRVENTWVSKSAEGEFIIKGLFTELEFYVDGIGTIEATIDGETKTTSLNAPAYSKWQFEKPTAVTIKINKLKNSKDLIIKNIRCADYQLSFELSEGNLIRTGEGMIIPKKTGHPRYLIIRLKANATVSPWLKYIYIGSPLIGDYYETETFTAGKNAVLLIDANCSAELISVTTGVVIKDYTTLTNYSNYASAPVYLELNMSEFGDIEKSHPAVSKMTYKNRTGHYVKINPGETFSSVKITGDRLRRLEKKPIRFYLQDKATDKVYVSKMAKAFIVKGTTESKKVFARNLLPAEANYFSIEGIKEDIKAVFTDDGTTSLFGDRSQSFYSLYLIPQKTKSYVLHEQVVMASKEIRNIDLSNRFFPQLSSSTLTLLHIEKPGGLEEVTIQFEENDSLNSVGIKKVKIIGENSFLEKQLSTHKIVIRYNAMLASYMALPPSFEGHESAEFIIEPDKQFELVYENEKHNEAHYVRDDGFNKLKYSNILAVLNVLDKDNKEIAKSKYDLLKEEGIIYWKDASLTGQSFSIIYEYRAPTYIKPAHLDILYDIVGHTVNALNLEGTLSYYGLEENYDLSKEDVLLISSADRYVVRSTNSAIKASVESGTIYLSRVKSESALIINPGYYYKDGEEFYFMAAPVKEELGSNLFVHLNEVNKLNNALILKKQATNYLSSSSMTGGQMRKVMEYHITRDEEGISSLNRISACDTLDSWHALNADLYLTNGINGKGLYFKGYENESYGILEITDSVFDGAILSLYADDTLAVYLAEQSDKNFLSTIYPDKPLLLSKAHNIANYEFGTTAEKRFYLVIKGQGVIDDIIISKNKTDVHKKLINQVLFDVQEETVKNSRYLITADHATQHQTEVDREGYIRTSTDMNWGLTQFAEVTDWHKGTYANAVTVKDRYIKGEKAGAIYYTPIYEVPKKEHVSQLFLRVNKILLDNQEGLTLHLLTSDDRHSTFTEVASSKGNEIIIYPSKLKRFVKAAIEMPSGKIIESVSFFVEYKESTNTISVRENEEGEWISKIYDLGSPMSFYLKRFNLDAFGKHSLFVRGIRQDEKDMVYSDWKRVEVNSGGEVTNHVDFNEYELIQLKVQLLSSEARVKLISYDIEVI